jgi:putative phosphoribosyl transferase
MAEWHTLMAQTHLPARACGFESRSGHSPGDASVAVRVSRAWPAGTQWVMPSNFADRRDAGRRLAGLLADLGGVQGAGGAGTAPDVVVLGLPRGGVPVAAEVASALGASLDVLVVGKVGVPGHEELALAAVADDGTVARNHGVIAAVRLSEDDVTALARRKAAELARRAGELRGARPPAPLDGRAVVIVDDGMATGATMRVALSVVRRRLPRLVVAAVPVASSDAVAAVRPLADRVECLLTPPGFRAVGPWYADFTQVDDGEVRDLLSAAQRGDGA